MYVVMYVVRKFVEWKQGESPNYGVSLIGYKAPHKIFPPTYLPIHLYTTNVTQHHSIRLLFFCSSFPPSLDISGIIVARPFAQLVYLSERTNPTSWRLLPITRTASILPMARMAHGRGIAQILTSQCPISCPMLEDSRSEP